MGEGLVAILCVNVRVGEGELKMQAHYGHDK